MIDLQDVNVGNPFPGLRPFETEEYHLFFGREGQSDELIKRLSVTRFLAVVGTSGSGKSSLIRAGLLPALHGGLMPGAGSSWRVALIRPGHDPIGNLAHELGAIGVLDDSHADAEIQNALIETTLRRSTLGLVDAVRQARLSPHERLLVVVDQFEELFRFKEARKETDSEDDALGFVKLLIEASAQVEVPIYVVLTMRSDFLGDCSQFAGLPEAINQGQYLIPRMSRDERRAAITGPVAVGGGQMTVPLINRLLNDVGDNPDQLPILQHALMRTWDYSVAHRRNGEAIGLEHYEAIGSMAEALSRHADEAFHELPNERSRLIGEKIFKALTEQGAANRETRRPVPLHQLCSIAGASEAEVVAVIETFRREGRSFLMPPTGTPLEPDTIIDISHESLIRNWERLHKWVIDEARSAQIYRRLAEAAVLYHRKEEGLLSGPFLQIALEWREKHRPNRVWAYRYNPEFETADRFLDASRDERDAKLAAEEQKLQEERDRESRELKQAAALAEKEKRLAEAEKQRAEEQAAARERELKQAQAFAEAEQQRAEEKAAARQRELEQAQDFAAQQTRAAVRLKRLTFALVLISLLAVGAAVGAGYAYAQAKESEGKATGATAEAKEAYRRASMSLAAETEAKIEADKQRKIADQRASEAEEAKRDAQAAQSTAEQAAENARSAAQREAKAAQVARDAESAARATAAKLQAATDRNRWSRDGLAAFQRGDYEEALNAFEIVRDNTQLEANRDGKIVDAETARIDGWTLANIGATQRAMGNLKAAVNSYENALKILDYTLDPDDAVRFDTYHGLADAYLDVMQTDKAEDFYKRALEFLEQNSPGKPPRIAEGLENLARLYRRESRYAEAEPLYKRILKIREDDKSNSPKLVATLKEFARFYVDQNRYKEAAALYPKILSIQETSFISGEPEINLRSLGDSEAEFRGFADSYRDLGEMYIGLGEERKAKDAHQLARSLQDYWAKLRQFFTRATVPDRTRTYDEYGRAQSAGPGQRQE